MIIAGVTQPIIIATKCCSAKEMVGATSGFPSHLNNSSILFCSTPIFAPPDQNFFWEQINFLTSLILAIFLTDYNLAFLTEIFFVFCERFLMKCKVAFLC